MKASTVVIILGVVALGGYAAYKLIKNKNEADVVNEDVTNVAQENLQNTKELEPYEKSVEDAVDNLKAKKANIQNDIVQRHEEAAKIMKDSMEHILADETKTVLSENINDFNDIDDSLDKLLDD